MGLEGIKLSERGLSLKPAALWAAGATSTGVLLNWLLQLESFPLGDENMGRKSLGLMIVVAGIFSYAVLLAVVEWGLRERVKSSWAVIAWGGALTILTLPWFPLAAMTSTLYVGTLIADRLGATRRVPWSLVWPLWIVSPIGVTFAFLHYLL